MTRHPALFVALVTLLVALGSGSMDVYLPSMPSMVTALNTDAGLVQLTMSVFVLGYALSMLVYGPLTDRFGRRGVLIGGVMLYVAASIACTMATTIEMLIGFRLVQAVGACVGPVVGRAMVRDMHGVEGTTKIFAYVAAAMSLTPVLAPFLGGYLEIWFGWRANFVFMSALGTLVLIAALGIIRETHHTRDPATLRPRRIAGNYLFLATRRLFLGYALSQAVMFGGVFCFIVGSSFVLIDLVGARPEAFGALFASVAIVFGVGSLIASRLLHRLGVDRTALIGIGIFATGASTMLGLALAGILNEAAIIVPMMICACGTGLAQPVFTAGAVAHYPQMAGTAAALSGFFQMGTAASVGAILAHVENGTQFPMVLGIFTSSVLLASIFVTQIWRHRSESPAGAAVPS